MTKLIFIFLDGVGIGKRSKTNPFFLAQVDHMPFYQGNHGLPDGSEVKAIGSQAGIEGIPQSATCQTALFTGVSGPALGNKHLQGYPNPHLKKIIARQNIFSLLGLRDVKAKFINAYPVFDTFFSLQHVRINEDGRFWFSAFFPEKFKKFISVSSCMLIANGETPLGQTELQKHQALYQDYSNRSLIERGLKLSPYSPMQAGKIIYRLSQKYDFILYEYFQTDIFGHRRSFPDCLKLISDLNLLVQTLFSLLDKRKETLLITSDHGNLEDLSHRHHTRNPVPLLAWGRHGDTLRKKITAIEDVTPALVDLF